MAVRPTKEQLAAEVPAALASLLDIPERELEVLARTEADLLVTAAGHSFVVEVLGAASPGAFAAHAAQVAAAARSLRREAVPLLVVPYMSDAGRRVCEDARIPWFDLSGNAHIVAPGIRIIIDGRPNRFRGPGRPASTFAPKSARVVRWLLENEGRALTQRETRGATSTASTSTCSSRGMSPRARATRSPGSSATHSRKARSSTQQPASRRPGR